MTIRFIFPCLPYSPSLIEPMFEAQREAAQGFESSLLSYEDLQQEGRLMVRPPADPEEILVLRGWMFKAEEYAEVLRIGALREWRFLSSLEDYSRCHFMDGWMDELGGLTPDTVKLEWQRERITELLTSWGRAFVKDSVKSCTVDGLPIVCNWDELVALKARMDEYRGYPESTLFYRQVEDFLPDSERRLFVLKGRVFHPDAPAEALALGRLVAERIRSPFYSVDVILRRDGAWRVVELGDGQVSDLKEWTPQQFFDMWQES